MNLLSVFVSIFGNYLIKIDYGLIIRKIYPFLENERLFKNASLEQSDASCKPS